MSSSDTPREKDRDKEKEKEKEKERKLFKKREKERLKEEQLEKRRSLEDKDRKRSSVTLDKKSEKDKVKALLSGLRSRSPQERAALFDTKERSPLSRNASMIEPSGVHAAHFDGQAQLLQQFMAVADNNGRPYTINEEEEDLKSQLKAQPSTEPTARDSKIMRRSSSVTNVARDGSSVSGDSGVTTRVRSPETRSPRLGTDCFQKNLDLFETMLTKASDERKKKSNEMKFAKSQRSIAFNTAAQQTLLKTMNPDQLDVDSFVSPRVELRRSTDHGGGIAASSVLKSSSAMDRKPDVPMHMQDPKPLAPEPTQSAPPTQSIIDNLSGTSSHIKRAPSEPIKVVKETPRTPHVGTIFSESFSPRKWRIMIVLGAGLSLTFKSHQWSGLELKSFNDYKNTIMSFGEDFQNTKISLFHSNSEGDVITKLCLAQEEGKLDGLIINPAGFNCGYEALGCALEAIDVPVVEVQDANLSAIKRSSNMTSRCAGTIQGFGVFGYQAALKLLINSLETSR